jgi:hypothetical protein
MANLTMEQTGGVMSFDFFFFARGPHYKALFGIFLINLGDFLYEYREAEMVLFWGPALGYVCVVYIPLDARVV